MPIRVTCPCGRQWDVDEDFAGERILCARCSQRVVVPRRSAPAVRARCPNARCGRVMTLNVPAGTNAPRCRCPACATVFELGLGQGPGAEGRPVIRCGNPACAKKLRLPAGLGEAKCRCPACGQHLNAKTALAVVRPEAEEEEGGTYGFAAETSVSYLLTREAEGRLTREEKQTKDRLIAERLASRPDCCPACEAEWNAQRPRCKACGFDRKTGRRVLTDHDPKIRYGRSDEIASPGEGAQAAASIAGAIIGGIIEGLSS